MQSGLSARLTVSPGAWRGPAALALAAGLALAAALFQAVLGWDIVGAGADIWRNPPGEMAGALAAAEAVLRAPWAFPLTAAYDLRTPEANLAVQAGAPAWLIVAIKALGLREAVSPLGLQLALGWVLQPAAMILLLRAAGVRRWTVLAAGAALSLLAPVWLAPQLGGPTASGHFVVMLALALAIDSSRRGLTPGRILLFCALAAAAMGLFTPHAAAVAALFLSAAASEIAQGRPGAWRRAAGGGLRVALAAATAAFVLSGAIDGRAMSPQITAPIYPGLGIALLALLAAGLWFRDRSAARPELRRFGPLAAALAGLTIWAAAEAQLVGAPGRLWARAPYLEAPLYAALTLALAGLEARWRPRWTLAALILAVGLQAVDAGGLLRLLRAWYAQPPASDLAALQAPALAGRPFVLLAPCAPTAAQRLLMDRLSLIAVRAGGVSAEAGCASMPGGVPPAGLHDPRITVVVDPAAKPAAPESRPDCRLMGPVVACGRGLAGPAPELREPYVVDFTGGAPVGLGVGWSSPEPDGVWSAAKLAGLILVAPVYAPDGLTLDIEGFGCHPIGRATQRITVSHDNGRITRWEVPDTPGAHRVDVPPGMARPGELFTLEFFIPDAVPVSRILPGSTDARELGFKLQRVRVSPLKADG